ncbi:MAG: hypothetical protein ACJAZS_000657 [Alteromonas naphthalenivorans]|jgi:hypothetical protein
MMKKLFVFLSIFGLITVQAADQVAKRIQVEQAAEVEEVKIKVVSLDGIEFELPADHRFQTIKNVTDDLGSDAQDMPVPLPMVDAAHLREAIALYQAGYQFPVTGKVLQDRGITLESLLSSLDYLDPRDDDGNQSYLKKFYSAWANHDDNQELPVYCNVSGNGMLDSMNLKTVGLPDTIQEDQLVFTLEDKKSVHNYLERAQELSVQDLMDFDKMPRVERITRMGRGGGRMIVSFNFEGQRISSLKGLQNVPDDIKNHIQELIFSGNRLSCIEQEYLVGFTVLRKLLLDNNEITTIPCFALPSVASLDLENNNITHIAENTFTDLDKLQTIFLKGNPIETIAPEAFKKLPVLRAVGGSRTLAATMQPRSFVNTPWILENVLLRETGNDNVDCLKFPEGAIVVEHERNDN